MKNEDFVKNTQEILNEKVIPAAKEGLDKTVETAQDLFEKGKDFVSDLLKEAGKKSETVGEKAAEIKKEAEVKAEDLKTELGKKTEELKKDASGFFKKQEKEIETKKEELLDFTSSKKEDVSKVINSGKEEITVGKNNLGKKIAGVALATAAAAGAYALYQNKKAKDEQVKAEFSEKMKKWNELNGEDLNPAKTEEHNVMAVRPGKVYSIGKNALLGEDIIVNISPIDKEVVFNPDEVSEPVNHVEELRKRATEVAKAAGIKAKELSSTMGEKAGELKENLEKKANEVKQAAMEKAESLKEKAEDVTDDLGDKVEDVKDEVSDKVEEVKEAVSDKVEEVKDTVDETLENKMESDGKEVVDNLVEDAKDAVSDKVEEVKDGFEDFKNDIEWQEDESVIVQKGEELKQKAQEGFDALKDKFTQVKDTVNEKVETFKKDREKEVEPELTYVEEYNVTIHNKGNKDYFFSPMLIQRYNSKKRQTVPTPFHEEGTTLEQRIIKPGETYSGKLFISKSSSDDALIMFEDMLMRNSVAILLEDELDDEFIKDEKADLFDELLFEEDYTIYEDEPNKENQ
ncbi:MAG: apolipoprotein A1/A4/E family protein [Clostridiaceae bacterium]